MPRRKQTFRPHPLPGMAELLCIDLARPAQALHHPPHRYTAAHHPHRLRNQPPCRCIRPTLPLRLLPHPPYRSLSHSLSPDTALPPHPQSQAPPPHPEQCRRTGAESPLVYGQETADAGAESPPPVSRAATAAERAGRASAPVVRRRLPAPQHALEPALGEADPPSAERVVSPPPCPSRCTRHAQQREGGQGRIASLRRVSGPVGSAPPTPSQRRRCQAPSHCSQHPRHSRAPRVPHSCE
jgi:hypothetical protein